MFRTLTLALLVALLLTRSAFAWGNGPQGNAQTDEASECAAPPYSTHDWIADHALALVTQDEKAWLLPHKALYLLGTEAPDNDDIPASCPAPNTGYDDRRKGHSVEWQNSWSEMFRDRAARRAQEEYGKAVIAFNQGDTGAAAYYLGAMAHYIGDVSQYGHVVTFETKQHHSGYETWAKSRTASFAGGSFEGYITTNPLVRRTPYTAAKRVARATGKGLGKIKSAWWMEQHYSDRSSQVYLDSVGHALNYRVNELADVLHTFYLNVVAEE